jgi:hypothetical protein
MYKTNKIFAGIAVYSVMAFGVGYKVIAMNEVAMNGVSEDEKSRLFSDTIDTVQDKISQGKNYEKFPCGENKNFSCTCKHSHDVGRFSFFSMSFSVRKGDL